MISPELEALLQGALDQTLTQEQHDRLARMMSESSEARDRAAELNALAGLIDSLGQADAPPGLVNVVLAQVAHHPRSVRPLTFQKGVTVNKKILFGLAAAAAIVLAVITYSNYPAPTVGTEATIGAAQRAQAPQIAANDVKLGDTSTQEVFQTEFWDQLAKDEHLRTALQDENFRAQLRNIELRKSLSDENIMRAMRDPNFARNLQDPSLIRQLNDPEMVKQMRDTNFRMAIMNQAFADALRSDSFRAQMRNPGLAAAMASAAFQSALRNPNFEASLRSQAFALRMARAQ